MGTVRILFPLPTRSTNTQRPSLLLDVPALERRELARAQRTAEKHGKNRTVPFAFHGVAVGLGEQVARLFPREPVPCPVAGLAGSYNSAVAIAELSSASPPVIKTVPVVSNVAVCPNRFVVMSPERVNVPGDCAIATGIIPSARIGTSLVLMNPPPKIHFMNRDADRRAWHPRQLDRTVPISVG
jgi:hypothetical protein